MAERNGRRAKDRGIEKEVKCARQLFRTVLDSHSVDELGRWRRNGQGVEDIDPAELQTLTSISFVYL